MERIGEERLHRLGDLRIACGLHPELRAVQRPHERLDECRILFNSIRRDHERGIRHLAGFQAYICDDIPFASGFKFGGCRLEKRDEVAVPLSNAPPIRLNWMLLITSTSTPGVSPCCLRTYSSVINGIPPGNTYYVLRSAKETEPSGWMIISLIVRIQNSFFSGLSSLSYILSAERT